MLRSETYVNTLLKGLQDLKERNVGCDLTLSSKDGSAFTVHRIVMAAASSYFMMKVDSEISSGQIHVLKNIDSSCLEALINFAYTGELDLGSISKTAMWPLLSACTELQMTDALNLCHDYMAGNIETSKPTRPRGRRAAASQPTIKMELDMQAVKQEGMGDVFGDSYDGFDEDSFPAADDSYYTGDSFIAGDAVVKLTPLEDDPSIDPDYLSGVDTPKKRKRGRPRKSDTPVFTTPPTTSGRRGRPPRKKQATEAVVEYGRTPASRGRGRPKKTPGTRRKAEMLKGKQCSSCDKVVKLNSLLCIHNRILHNRRTYRHSLRRKLSQWSIGAHAVVQRAFESSSNVYGCSRCGEMFNMWTRWRRHYIQRHLRRYSCANCKVNFSSSLDLQYHRHLKHKSKLVVKRRSGLRLPETTPGGGRRQRQQLVSIPNVPQEAADEKSSWERRQLLRELASAKNTDGNFVCYVCHKVLKRKSNLEQHLLLHSEVDRLSFDCKYCGKAYATKRSLEMHTLAVHEGKMMRCSFEGCDKKFVTKGSLTQHMQTHIGNYTYKCEICDRGFSKKDHFATHMNRHYNIKAFQCGLCGNKFTTDSDLTRHLGLCGLEKTVKCEKCDKMFKTQAYMEKHVMSVHEKNKPYLCNVCGQVFSYASQMIRHRAKHA